MVNQQTNFTIALTTIAIVVAIVIFVGGFFSLKHIERRLDETRRQIQKDFTERLKEERDYLEKWSEIQTSASIHLQEANAYVLRWDVLSRDEKDRRLDLLTQAVRSAALSLGFMLQRQVGRTGSPTFYVLKSAVAAIHGTATYIEASRLNDTYRRMIKDKLGMVVADHELSSEEDILKQAVDLLWWLDNPEKILKEK